jgi:hypothetical protein
LTRYFAGFRGARYDAGVFGLAGRRLAEGVVGLFALLGFAFVPLGKKTALEHTLDIFTTPAARSAWLELGSATQRLKERLIATLLPAKAAEETLEPVGAQPQVPALPSKKHVH